MSSDNKAVGQRARTTFGGDAHPRVCASASNDLNVLRRSAPTYAEISASLSVPVGSIGPTRCRLLGKVRDALSDHEGRELANAG